MRTGWGTGTAVSLLVSVGAVCSVSWAQPEVAREFSFTGRTPPGAPVPLENLFVVGDLLVAQPQPSEMARWGPGPLVVWDGSRWSGIPGTPSSGVSSMVSDGERLYLLVRGSTEEASRIDTWDGAGWTRGALPVPEDARQLAYCDDALVAIGWVVDSYLEADSWIQRWDGAAWTELFRDDDPEVFSSVEAAGPGAEILIRFRQRATGAESFERWRDGFWHAVQVPDSVDLDSFAWSSAGWLGIDRDRSPGADQATLYRLQEDSWKPLGPSFPARSFNLLSTGGVALLGTLIGEGRELTSALWSVEGDSLRSLGALTDADGDFGGIEAAVSWQGGIVCGGSFVSIGGVGAWNVAVLRGSAVERIRDGDAIDGWIEQIVPFGDGIAVAGDFAYAGPFPCAGVAIRDEAGWVDAPAARAAPLRAMQEYRGSLVAASGDSVLVWTGTRWKALPGGGVQWWVSALGIHQGDLIAAGIYLRGIPTSTRGVARWDGAEWSGLGRGIEGWSHCLESWSGYVAVGGDLRRAGFEAVSNIALWDGADWYPMGPGLQGRDPPSPYYSSNTGVVALARYGDLLLAAGDFVRAGSEHVPGIALWDGAAWRRLGDDDPEGIRPREVSSIAVSGNRVFAHGTFEIGRGAGRSAFCVFENGRWRVISIDTSVRAMQALADGSVWISASRPEALLPGAMRYDLLRLAPEDAPRLIDRPSILSIDALGPIPARGSLDVRYSLTRNAPLRYGLYNVGGRRIVEIDGGVQAAGPHAIHIDAESLSLPLILSGVYFLRIEAGDDVVSRRIVVVR